MGGGIGPESHTERNALNHVTESVFLLNYHNASNHFYLLKRVNIFFNVSRGAQRKIKKGCFFPFSSPLLFNRSSETGGGQYIGGLKGRPEALGPGHFLTPFQVL